MLSVPAEHHLHVESICYCVLFSLFGAMFCANYILLCPCMKCSFLSQMIDITFKSRHKESRPTLTYETTKQKIYLQLKDSGREVGGGSSVHQGGQN